MKMNVYLLSGVVSFSCLLATSAYITNIIPCQSLTAFVDLAQEYQKEMHVLSHMQGIHEQFAVRSVNHSL